MLSMVPPRALRQAAPTKPTMPRLAIGAPSWLPIASTSSPRRSDVAAAISAGASPSGAKRSAATSVEGSRPASVAATRRPPGSVTVMSSSRSSASSAVTIPPARQWMPLVGHRPPPCTATRCEAVRSTSCAVCVESAAIGLLGSAMRLISVTMHGRHLAWSHGRGYWPDGGGACPSRSPLLLVLVDRGQSRHPGPRRAEPVLPLRHERVALAQDADSHHVRRLLAVARRGRIDRRAATGAERLHARISALRRRLQIACRLPRHPEGRARD